MSEAGSLWQRYCKYLYVNPGLGFSLDISRVRFTDSWFDGMKDRFAKAVAAMADLEKGAVANRDENRMVGHYWLRDASRAPDAALASEISGTLADLQAFVKAVHDGVIRGGGGNFTNLLLIGIGGSALGPQLVAHALGSTSDKIKPYFLDNTDPDGFDRAFARLGHEWNRTLAIVVSKSGGTPETRNGMLEVQAAYKAAGVEFARHAVAVTQVGSQLDKTAVAQQWLKRFPMWDWVGGRTSVMSAVGLLPAALQGIDIVSFLRGAAAMDEATRSADPANNPATLLAAAWHYAGQGRGAKDMILLPYKDRLELFSRYLQQLVMESLGKELDRGGRKVCQGIAVYGNKGSTDQHAYVQQLRDGVNNFFATFIKVVSDRKGASLEVGPGVTSGDYLNGFMVGTRRALYENDRDSITITINEVSPYTLGMLIALYERAVGLYAELVDINAYHQPGVEAGKKAAQAVLDLQQKVLAALQASAQPMTALACAQAAGAADEVETVFFILRHLAGNPGRHVSQSGSPRPDEAVFAWVK